MIRYLGCSTNTSDSLDDTYCTEAPDDPKSNDRMDKQVFKTSNSAGESDSCTVQERMQSIEDANAETDRLSEVDQISDGSIGAFKDVLENVLNTNRAVPLFEFRRLVGVRAADMEDHVKAVEQAVVDYHNAHTDPPRYMQKREGSTLWRAQRRDCPAPTSATTPIAISSASLSASPKPMYIDVMALILSNGWEEMRSTPSSRPSAEMLKSKGYRTRVADRLCAASTAAPAVTLSMDWPSGADFHPNIYECIRYMTTIMDSCDGNDPQYNPLNWKHSGNDLIGIVKYNIFPQI